MRLMEPDPRLLSAAKDLKEQYPGVMWLNVLASYVTTDHLRFEMVEEDDLDTVRCMVSLLEYVG